jgi:hypothetical protein
LSWPQLGLQAQGMGWVTGWVMLLLLRLMLLVMG